MECGTIVNKLKQTGNKEAQCQYHVTSISDLKEHVIPFFDRYQPILKKRDFELW
ncbi:unnamed protein product, partial [marine sediment metagenome]